MIEQKVNSYISSYTNLNGFDYGTLRGAYNNSDGFIQYDTLNFESRTGYAHLTGNEILPYPELSKALRTIEEYPIYKKSYPVSKELRELKGLNFLIAFTDYVKACEADFAEEIGKINAKINNLIYLYGTEKTKPVITGILKDDRYNYIHTLIINGVPFKFTERYNRDKQNLLIGIDLNRLIDCAAFNAQYALFDAALLNTPYIAIRVRKSWKHIGRVIWYNLDEMKIMTTAEINAIKKKGKYQEVKNKE